MLRIEDAKDAENREKSKVKVESGEQKKKKKNKNKNKNKNKMVMKKETGHVDAGACSGLNIGKEEEKTLKDIVNPEQTNELPSEGSLNGYGSLYSALNDETMCDLSIKFGVPLQELLVSLGCVLS